MKIEANLNEINIVCKALDNLIKGKNHIIILLYGDIGAGKTTLIQKYARFIGLNDCVTSPTFSLMNEYSGKIFHYDLYNRSQDDLLALGILDLLEEEGIHFVEWSNESLQKILESAFLDIKFIKIKKFNNKRIYEFD
ncbi:tRNA (adenosine(37)-N6)-threonylcarbamoyltransferase complex ATPase subunit type 1 TsaE [Helicobacter sp. 16-1353]|uniref:tRNA (adenosine(37)-N6)-threonylcarbamoyltransferase complex ATPase subunit type 1 TsaE n=1 Tax=Helicobacter sp. 16-1353 TaxID=2004996 RepID=UPI000DCD9F88|nr:tRNA (adenosine(37)-N6)-threonylcarbamoyltransferase complex ATPase subunit type 1 TsaE [Helicobacter sp. 16-1353]RAX55276.1 tRNA (adenosine(37)-N6)-threonylcarbamoyltransferase complex ATPase subunit type 1 TsaE [Helicobacter sp. 16-1353]